MFKCDYKQMGRILNARVVKMSTNNTLEKKNWKKKDNNCNVNKIYKNKVLFTSQVPLTMDIYFHLLGITFVIFKTEFTKI